jgi:hypothetical protein
MPEEQMSTPQGGASSGDSITNNPEGASNDLQSQNTKLRQELARAKEIMRQAAPIAQLGEALQNAPGSEAIIAKLQKGEPLTDKQAAAATEELRATTNLTEERIVELLEENSKKLEQRMWEGQKAEREMDALHKRAMKEFPGYENVYQSQEFKRLEDLVLSQAQRAFNDGRTVIPDDEPDPYWWIKKEAWSILKAKNPELAEKPAGKTESERQGAIAGQSGKSGGAPEAQKDDLPDYVKNLNTRKYGGRLSDLKRKR